MFILFLITTLATCNEKEEILKSNKNLLTRKQTNNSSQTPFSKMKIALHGHPQVKLNSSASKE